MFNLVVKMTTKNTKHVVKTTGCIMSSIRSSSIISSGDRKHDRMPEVTTS